MSNPESTKCRDNGGLYLCCNPKTEQKHPCPFKQEINDDETTCECCDNCQAECADEI